MNVKTLNESGALRLSNQEGFIFTNEEYEPGRFDDLVVITY